MAWTVATTDWMEPGTGTIIDRVESGAAPGVVVLTHDAGGDRSQTVHAIRKWLPHLLDSGYRMTVPSRRVYPFPGSSPARPGWLQFTATMRAMTTTFPS